MDAIKCIGGCVLLFFIAIILDVVGLIVIFVGIFANLRIDGRFYGDFLIYSGALIIFGSLACWLMWYIGNIQVSDDDIDGSLKKTSSFVQLARKLSERLSQKLKSEGPRAKCVEDDEDYSQVGLPAHKASRVTWGKSTAYLNQGYDASLDSLPDEKKNKRPDLPTDATFTDYS
ncbi:transmembrane protein 238 [Centroberyx affinis]|uniref:transmembrane protein 238 n=1 Tax=Centroberyx affinis TaxID=166261 RepID=UPI003A5C5D3B